MQPSVFWIVTLYRYKTPDDYILTFELKYDLAKSFIENFNTMIANSNKFNSHRFAYKISCAKAMYKESTEFHEYTLLSGQEDAKMN